MEPELKEILIWAGGALVLLVVGLFILGGMDRTVRSYDVKLGGRRGKPGQYQVYQQAYSTRPGNLPGTQALAWRQHLADVQEAELLRVESRVLTPVPESVPPAVENPTNEYMAAVGWSQDIIAELKGRASAQGLQLPQDLPFTNSEELVENQGRLRIQKLQVYAMRAILDQLIDAGPRRIDQCKAGDPYSDGDHAYLVLPFYVSLLVDGEVLERLLKDLSEGRGARRSIRLNASSVEVQPEGDAYRLVLIANLVMRRSAEMERVREADVQPPPPGDGEGNAVEDPPTTPKKPPAAGGGRGSTRPTTAD